MDTESKAKKWCLAKVLRQVNNKEFASHNYLLLFTVPVHNNKYGNNNNK